VLEGFFVDAMKLLIEIIRLITMNWEGKEAADWCLVNNQNKRHRQNTDELLSSPKRNFHVAMSCRVLRAAINNIFC
jgi:hypothetical protein